MPQEKKKSPYVKSQARKVKHLKRNYDAANKAMEGGIHSVDPLIKVGHKLSQNRRLKEMRAINKETREITQRKRKKK